jgi:hypothetical protein
MDSLASPNIWAHEPVVMALVGFGLVIKFGKRVSAIGDKIYRILDIISIDLHILSIFPEILVASA